jgi:hypothetical protein
MSAKQLKDKRDEKLKSKPLEEKMKAAARLAALEMRNMGDIKEPDQLASGKSDDKGNMVWDDEDHDDD